MLTNETVNKIIKLIKDDLKDRGVVELDLNISMSPKSVTTMSVNDCKMVYIETSNQPQVVAERASVPKYHFKKIGGGNDSYLNFHQNKKYISYNNRESKIGVDTSFTSAGFMRLCSAYGLDCKAFIKEQVK